MNVETVKRRVADLRTRGGGGEEWHIEEDQLHLAVLRAIARGAEDPRGLAREAAKTADIEGVQRWYA